MEHENRNSIFYKIKCATQAEILRSHQRDADFVKQLQEKLAEVLQNFGLHQRSLRQYIHSDIPFKLIYFVFTSGMKNQTLGEEYTGIVQTNLKELKVPSLTARISSAILEIFGEKMLLILLKKLHKRINEPNTKLRPEAVTFLSNFLLKFSLLVPIIILFHKGIFYMSGRYYSLSKRSIGLEYAKVIGKQIDNVSWGLKLLGIVTILQSLLRMWQCYKTEDTHAITSNLSATSVGNNCQLCFEATATTATLCGHLFCWNCLSDWLRKKSQCPFCRSYMPASRVIPVMNL